MTKRLVALLLALIMLLACLVGCGQKEDEIENIAAEGSERTTTLSMYLMSEEEVSKEQALAIQEAVNKITKSKFKTQLVLHYFTEDEYYDALDEAYSKTLDADLEAPEETEALKGEKESETAEETYVDQYGVVQLKYPTIPDYQVDLFYISGYDRLNEFIEQEKVEELSTELTNASKTIKSYVHPSYLDSMNSICNGVYAIPGNAPIGEYTYILLNKEILKEYNHVPEDFDSIFCKNSQYLLDLVSKHNKDYVPFRSFTGDPLDISHMSYVNIDKNDEFDNKTFSLIGSYYVENERPDANIKIYNTNGQRFQNEFKTLVSYKENGYYGTKEDANKPFAMGYIKGGLEVVEQYKDDYEIIVHETPMLESKDVFENMFAVSSDTDDLSRSMEILTYLYTNKDFNNLLVYGIEGENYEFVDSDELDENGKPYQLVNRYANNEYVMSPEKLGNMLLSYPTVGQSPRINEMYKQQNMDSSVSPVMGMSTGLVLENGEFSYEYAYYLRDLSSQIFDELIAIDKVEDVDPYFEKLRNLERQDKMFGKVTNTAALYPNGEEAGGVYSLPALFEEWKKMQNTSSGE